MTGYANASSEATATAENGSEITRGATPSVHVELRSVNSRFLDIAFRVPDEFRSLEPALRDILTARLRRGKVELRLVTRDRKSVV